MSIKRTIIVAIATLALVALVAPVATQAQTVSTLMTEIAQLQAQLNGLQGTTTVSGSVPSACVGITFSRNLTVGSTGSDVKCLQVLLNTSATTQVATSGAGSPGMETMTFGPRTLAAVRIYQAQQGFTPANQVGPLTRAKLNAWLGSGTTTTTTTTTLPAGCTSTSGFSPITGASCATGVVTTVPSGSISAMLSSDTPASSAIVSGQATADLLHINFTGTGTVTSVTLQRSGISDQNTLTNVYLFDGNTRITDGYSFNVSGQIVMNGLNIAVNGSHVISVRADTSSTAYLTASTIATSLTGFTGNGVATSANVMGNTMSIVVGNLATAYLGANTVYNSNAVVNINAGTTQYTVWSAPLQINTRAVWLKMANFRIVGSAPSNALANIRLFIDGVDTGKVATMATINGSNYAMFDLSSSPISLTTGSHTVDVRADIVTGADRSIQVSLQLASDLTITDPQIGVNIAVLGASGAAFGANTGANIMINAGSGSVVVDPTFTSITNVSAGATNAVIGRFDITGYGEDVKVNSINVTPTLSNLASTTVSSGGANSATSQTLTVGSTTGFVAGNAISITSSATASIGTVTTVTDGTHMTVNFTSAPGSTTPTLYVTDKGLNNVTLYFNGSQIGSTQSPTVSGTVLNFTLGSQMIAPAGQVSTLEVRADLQGSNNVAYGAGTIVTDLPAETSLNAQGQSSQTTVNLPSGDVTTTGLTIGGASLVVSKNNSYSTQAISPNVANQTIGSFIVQNQSTSESIRLTTLTVALTENGTTALNATELTGLTSLRTSDTTGSGSTPIQPADSNTFSVNDTLAPGQQMTINVLANTGSATTLPQVVTKLTVASIGVTSNISSAGSAVTGQTITLASGSISASTGVTLVSSPTSTTPASFVPGGAGNSSTATFTFVATNAPAQITELKFTVSDASSGSVTNICVTGTSNCAQPNSGTAYLTGLNLPVPQGGGLTQAFQVSYQTVGLTGLNPNQTSTISLASVKYTSGGTTNTICTSALGCSGGNILTAITAPASGAIHLVSSVPAITVVSTTGATLNTTTSGTTDAGRVTISGGASGLKVRQLTFNIGFGGYSVAPTVQADSTSTYLAIGATQVAACSISGTVATCHFTNDGTYGGTVSYANDFSIPANTSTTFDLFTKLSAAGTAGTGTLTENVTLGKSSTSSSTDGMLWDDTSTAGAANTSVNAVPSSLLSDFFIYGFPTQSTSVHN